jgi:hypothetical protein
MAATLMLALKLLLAFLLPLTSALKFDIQAHPGHESASKERCIRNFAANGQLVVVTATVSGSRGDGQTLNMHVSCKPGGLPLQCNPRHCSDKLRHRSKTPSTTTTTVLGTSSARIATLSHRTPTVPSTSASRTSSREMSGPAPTGQSSLTLTLEPTPRIGPQFKRTRS